MPQATATPEPLEEPPAWRAGSYGFLTSPVQRFSPVAPRAISCMLVLAKTIAPAACSRSTTADCPPRSGRTARVPAAVGAPSRLKRSLTVTNTPCSGRAANACVPSDADLSLRSVGLRRRLLPVDPGDCVQFLVGLRPCPDQRQLIAQLAPAIEQLLDLQPDRGGGRSFEAHGSPWDGRRRKARRRRDSESQAVRALPAKHARSPADEAIMNG